jgi:AcrR family transcriptional regulator
MPSDTPAPSTSAKGGRPQRRTQGERRNQAEEALLDAAVRLFARRGIDQTSLGEVGEEAGYSRGLVNHHFGSKAALVERLARRTQRDFVASLGPMDGRELQALLEIVDSYLDGVGQNSQQTRAFFVMWGAALPEEAGLRSVFVGDDARFRSGVEALVRSGQDNGTIRSAIDPAGVALVLVGLLRGIAAQYLISPESVALDGARAVCEQFVRQTLTPTSPED